MTAQDLYDFLRDIQNRGISLSKVDVNFRHDFDSDVLQVHGACEDLFDADTNSQLTSIVLYVDGSDK
jgi:hypothetical protein